MSQESPHTSYNLSSEQFPMVAIGEAISITPPYGEDGSNLAAIICTFENTLDSARFIQALREHSGASEVSAPIIATYAEDTGNADRLWMWSRDGRASQYTEEIMEKVCPQDDGYASAAIHSPTPTHPFGLIEINGNNEEDIRDILATLDASEIDQAEVAMSYFDCVGILREHTYTLRELR